ncbi:GDCCVxC domain-containing (seleno)protein [Spirosoma foliorum]|uniref:GDCCVxC domain-containing (seleno)protein n=1 Tax=Spirosoma foliorum TaxID=2710596 RepID=UPI0035AB6C18
MCPFCDYQQTEMMPVDACQFFYDCAGCGSLIRSLSGNCCVFCSYGSIKWPLTQEQKLC